MPRQPRQLMRQGVGDLLTRAQVLSYIGPAGELIFDRETLRIQNGMTPGGIPLLYGGHTSAPDANYQSLVTDTQIGFSVLTAARTVTLPDVDLYPLGQVLFIADESGQCSADRPITIMVGTGTGDTIAGQTAIQITDAYQGLGFRRGAANVWIIAR